MHIRHLAIDLVLVVAKLRAAFVTFFPVQKNFTYKHPSIDTTHADTRRHAERESFSFVFLPQILPLSLWRFRSPPPLLRLFDDVFARAGTARDGGESRERVSGDVRVEEHEN